MRRWKRLVLGLCVLLAAAVALILWDRHSEGTPTLSISFLGYTNRSMELPNLRARYAVVESGVTTAMFRVTNNRSVPINISSLVIVVVGTNGATSRYHATRSETGETQPWGAPRDLKPGEVRYIEAYVPPDFDSWWVYIPAFDARTQPPTPNWAMRWPPVRWTVEKFPRPIKASVATLGPFTNQPPASDGH